MPSRFTPSSDKRTVHFSFAIGKTSRTRCFAINVFSFFLSEEKALHEMNSTLVIIKSFSLPDSSGDHMMQQTHPFTTIVCCTYELNSGYVVAFFQSSFSHKSQA